MCTCGKVILVLGIIGVALFVVGFVLGFSTALDGLINWQIENSVRLENNTDQFDRWETLPFPLQFKIYAFNVVNPDEILKGEIPIVKEVGPFVYNQRRQKENIEYDEETDSFKYTQRQVFEFDEELSALSDDTVITVLNMPLQGIFLTIEGTSRVTSINEFWDNMFSNHGYFLSVTARELFFEGYHFCIAANLNVILRLTCNVLKGMIENSKTMTSDSEKITFSFFGHKNNSNDGLYEVSGGNKDIHTLGAILSWEEQNYLDTWVGENSTCNRIRGRDSSIYPPFNNESSSFDIFNTDLCRIVNLKANGTREYEDIEGIVLKLGIDEMISDCDKRCYCIKQTLDLNGERECLPVGFADMSSCAAAPILASYPHMLWADYDYANTVIGQEPDAEKHQTFVVIEPNTGTPLQGAKRIQFNIVTRPIEGLTITENLRHSVFPVIWVEEGFNLPDEQVQQLQNDFFARINMLNAVSYALIGVGAALMAICIGYFIFSFVTNKTKYSKHLVVTTWISEQPHTYHFSTYVYRSTSNSLERRVVKINFCNHFVFNYYSYS